MLALTTEQEIAWRRIQAAGIQDEKDCVRLIKGNMLEEDCSEVPEPPFPSCDGLRTSATNAMRAAHSHKRGRSICFSSLKRFISRRL